MSGGAQDKQVTILILIDGFLQSKIQYEKKLFWEGHNPYFNRWFSAINESIKEDEYGIYVTILILIDGFLQSINVISLGGF